jgi:hypothetical protein
MSNKAVEAVIERVRKTLNKSQYDDNFTFHVMIVWSCYILGNQKFLLTTDLPDGKYYEVTYNKDANEMYLDEYVRVHNEVIQCTTQ